MVFWKKNTITIYWLTRSTSNCNKVMLNVSRHSNNPVESARSAMWFNIVQLCVSGWLRSMSAVRGKNAAHSRWFNVHAKGGCHATDAVAACRPDWQARLQTDVHAALWSSVLRDTPTVMNTRQLLPLKAIVVSQASACCMFAYLHASVRVYWGDAFTVWAKDFQ